ncbi:hypothetical protein ACTXT7_003678 [Hymenolepis weldensis]
MRRATVLQSQMAQYLIDVKCDCEVPITLQFIENQPPCGNARLSVLAQTALALVVGERRLQMEHRDLHLVINGKASTLVQMSTG